MFLPSYFSVFYVWWLVFHYHYTKKFKTFQKKCFSSQDGWQKHHTQEFQVKDISRNMRCKLLQKRSTVKTAECSKQLQCIAIEKDIVSELNGWIFQICLKHVKLVIPKILFILVGAGVHALVFIWYFIRMILSEKSCQKQGIRKKYNNRVVGGGLPSEEGFKPVYYDIERLKRG